LTTGTRGSLSRFLEVSSFLRRILKERAPDDARQQLAARVIAHLEQSGFEIDEAEQVIRKRPPGPNHG
jgi:hypothetical protein